MILTPRLGARYFRLKHLLRASKTTCKTENPQKAIVQIYCICCQVFFKQIFLSFHCTLAFFVLNLPSILGLTSQGIWPNVWTILCVVANSFLLLGLINNLSDSTQFSCHSYALNFTRKTKIMFTVWSICDAFDSWHSDRQRTWRKQQCRDKQS